MIKILMIGTFVSKKSGSISISEKIAQQINYCGLQFQLVSSKSNKLLRLLEIILHVLFGKYNKIHIDTFSGQAFRIAQVVTILAGFRLKRSILSLRGGALPDFYIEYPKRVRKTLDSASYLQSPSLYLIEFFEKQGIDVHYLPNGINLNLFKYERKNINVYSLLWVRAFDEIYNPYLAIRALSLVKEYIPSASLTMIGPDKGLLRSSLELIDKLGLSQSVRIIGPIANDHLANYYHTHHVFLNTTRFESFGMAVMEAAACGIPIVSTNVGEIPYLWKNEENMMIVDSAEPVHFCQAVIKLVSSSELYENISVNARKKAEEYDWELIKEKWVQLLEDN